MRLANVLGSMSFVSLNQCTPSQSIALRYTTILSFRLCLGFQSDPLLSDCSTLHTETGILHTRTLMFTVAVTPRLAPLFILLAGWQVASTELIRTKLATRYNYDVKDHVQPQFPVCSLQWNVPLPLSALNGHLKRTEHSSLQCWTCGQIVGKVFLLRAYKS